MDDKKTVFLLRAYGDFLIAIHLASRSRSNENITLVASKHFECLYQALPLTLPPKIRLIFSDFKIRNGLLSCFTNRFFFSKQTFVELIALRKFIRNENSKGVYYMEQKKRILLPTLFVGYPFRYILSKQNVYRAYSDFFGTSIADLENLPSIVLKKGVKILIVPEARQQKRNISVSVIEQMLQDFAVYEPDVTIACFKMCKEEFSGKTIVYNSFSGLTNLINDTDLFIGCDSMPVHLAQLMKKPHYILYPEYVKDQFFTPYSLKHHTHFSFSDLASGKKFLPDG